MRRDNGGDITVPAAGWSPATGAMALLIRSLNCKSTVWANTQSSELDRFCTWRSLSGKMHRLDISVEGRGVVCCVNRSLCSTMFLLPKLDLCNSAVIDHRDDKEMTGQTSCDRSNG